jgi:hypothetical protein
MNDIPALLYNFALIAGTTWLVVELDWSMWCYLLTICFLVTKTGSSEKKDERTE